MTRDPTYSAAESVLHVANEVQFEEIDADVAHAIDDGEHAAVWGAERLGETEVRVELVYCEAGLNDTIETFTDEISEEDTVDEYLGELLRDKNMVAEMQKVREYWAEDRGEE